MAIARRDQISTERMNTSGEAQIGDPKQQETWESFGRLPPGPGASDLNDYIIEIS